jgi:hypothetical protein
MAIMRPGAARPLIWILLLAVLICEHAGSAEINSSAATAPAVEHTPSQPRSGQSVSIRAVTNAPKNAKAILRVQVIEPGKYLRKTDAAFTNSWQEFPMERQGGNFVASIPAEVQQHRRLVRYTVTLRNSDGSMTRLPKATNDCPNFAYFVYDGIPAWTGASRPGRTPPLTFSADFMKTLPAYHLIAHREDVEHSQWDGGSNKKRFFGTIVYEGRVYDHIQFLNRGKASTYVSGKNKWGLKFNDTEAFAARDLWGRRYATPWKSVSLTACASPWAQVNRGMAGMDEAVSFRAYQLAGVPSANTHWIQFRVISARDEAPPNDQYGGDVWGLYQVVQEPNGEWLQERGLPDGDIYYPETGVKHRAKNSPTNDTAFHKLMAGPRGTNAEAWWRTNLHLPRYYTFHALNRALGNVDVRPGANHYLYHEPDGRWCVVPWDLDMMFIAKTHQPGVVEQSRCLQVRELKVEYQNRAREVLDLFCSDASTNGGQVGQLVDELARFIAPHGFQRTWAELDMCVWNYHPRSNAKGQFYVTPYRDGRFGGEWTRTLATPDFAGFCKYITDYCTDSRPEKNYAINDGDQRGYGFGYLSVEANSRSAPERPTIRLPDRPANAAAANLRFEISDFKLPAGVTNVEFAAVQWRIAEISAPGVAGYRSSPRKYEIEELWRSAELTTQTNRFTLPLTMCEREHTYRVRARYKSNLGRWSHWSEPVQFVRK